MISLSSSTEPAQNIVKLAVIIPICHDLVLVACKAEHIKTLKTRQRSLSSRKMKREPFCCSNSKNSCLQVGVKCGNTTRPLFHLIARSLYLMLCF